MQGIFAFIQKHWDILADKVVGASGQLEKFPAALKRWAWLPAVQDGGSFPGFKEPEDRWYRLDELHPRSIGHLVCSQVPLFDGTDPAGPVQTALGMSAKPQLDLVVAHFDRLRELWTNPHISVDVTALTTSLRQIYTYFGQASRPQRGAPGAGTTLKQHYTDVLCIWDRPRRRFMRPRDVFAERVPFFEPHKVYVDADPLVQTGLDALGRRQKLELGDFIEFMKILCTYKNGTGCDLREYDQALNALSFISTGFDQIDEQGDIPVLTTTRQLIPLCEVYKDDVPHLKGRIEATNIKLIDPLVPARIRFAAPSLAASIIEVLDEPPTPSANREVEHVCRRVAAIFRSREFADGLNRIVASYGQKLVTA
jgi:hypothetical protein